MVIAPAKRHFFALDNMAAKAPAAATGTSYVLLTLLACFFGTHC